MSGDLDSHRHHHLLDSQQHRHFLHCCCCSRCFRSPAVRSTSFTEHGRPLLTGVVPPPTGRGVAEGWADAVTVAVGRPPTCPRAGGTGRALIGRRLGVRPLAPPRPR